MEAGPSTSKKGAAQFAASEKGKHKAAHADEVPRKKRTSKTRTRTQPGLGLWTEIGSTDESSSRRTVSPAEVRTVRNWEGVRKLGQDQRSKLRRVCDCLTVKPGQEWKGSTIRRAAGGGPEKRGNRMIRINRRSSESKAKSIKDVQRSKVQPQSQVKDKGKSE
ncbi:hypothetical protein C8R43DRAFT_948487 [Mycena crocata]|nr:hypothetical protein C8R43DRAFT_948487 [Mycena crocata]